MTTSTIQANQYIIGAVCADKLQMRATMPHDPDRYELAYTQEPSLTVKFALAGDDLDPDEITRCLGITPSQAWRKGEPIPKPPNSRFIPRPTFPFGKWIRDSPCSVTDDLAVQLAALLDLLEHAANPVAPLALRYQGEISIAYASGEQSIGFHLDSAILKRVYDLQVALDLTVYPIQEDGAGT